MNSSWTPRRYGAAALGLLSALPLALLSVMVASFAVDFVQTMRSFDLHLEEPVSSPATGFGGLGVALFGIGIVAAPVISACLLLFYCIDAVRNPAVPDDHRPIWIIALLIGSIVVFPAYWFLFWWRPATPARASARTT